MAQLSTSSSPEFLIRQARLSDSFQMGIVSYNAYINDPLIKFLAPGQLKYPETSKRKNAYRIMRRMLSARNITYVAYQVSNPGKIIGQIQFLRLGDSFQKPSLISAIWLSIMAWTLTRWVQLVEWWEPDLIQSAENSAKFERWTEVDDQRYWDETAFPERKERWHVQTCAVDPNWQRKGIGTLLMVEVQKRAQKDGVVIGIEANSVGAKMYESLGFRRLGDFFGDTIEGDTGGGGVYIWERTRVNEVHV